MHTSKPNYGYSLIMASLIFIDCGDSATSCMGIKAKTRNMLRVIKIPDWKISINIQQGTLGYLLPILIQ